jgi:hypothetical protein
MEYPKVLGPTITTGTSEIDLGGTGVRLASPCNGSLLAIKIEAARAGVPTTVESDTIAVRLKSTSGQLAGIVPYEAFAQPVNAGIGAEIKPYQDEAIWYPVNAPVKIGDSLQITAAELTTCTVHVYVGVTCLFADYIATPQYHSQIGTSTACGAAAQEYKMTTGIDIVGGKWIKKIFAMCTEVTPASGKGMIYKYRLSSTLFKHDGTRPGLPAMTGMGDIEFIGNFVPGMLSAGPTVNANADRLCRMEFPGDGVPIDTPAHIDCYHNATVAFNAAGSYNIQIVYTT